MTEPTTHSSEPHELARGRVLSHLAIGAAASIFEQHRVGLTAGPARLVGVADVNEALGRERAAALDVPFAVDYRELLADTRPDVAVIMTPHPFHAPIAVDCLRAGCHVLVEKPMAVHVGEADAMIAAALAANRLLAVNFQQRLRPEVRAAKRLLDGGDLGRIQHVDMWVAWPRSAAYFRTASWRATWRGEGGGLLMNQAPHDLDLIAHLVGRPSRVVAWTRTRFHRIETEDTVQAMIEWPSGALGSVHIATAEAGPAERLTLVGTRGWLRLERGRLTVETGAGDLHELLATTDERFPHPTFAPLDARVSGAPGDHAAIYRNLHAAILDGAPLVADGASGRLSLELANAMILSSHGERAVELPLDVDAYVELLTRLRGRSAIE